VTFGATAPIGINGNSVVVNEVFFTKHDVLSVAFEIWGWTCPLPMGRFHKVPGTLFMASQTGPGDILSCKTTAFNKFRMIHPPMHRYGKHENKK